MQSTLALLTQRKQVARFARSDYWLVDGWLLAAGGWLLVAGCWSSWMLDGWLLGSSLS